MFAVVGTLVDSLENWELRLEEDGVLVVDGKSGDIIRRCPADDLDSVKETFGLDDGEVIRLGEDEFVMPGLIDTHIHASQFPNAGLGLDLPLLGWLEKYTFPMELKFKDLDFARKVYSKVVEATLASGTTTAVYFATIHKEASLELCRIASELGQRALVGKVSMDSNNLNKDYVEDSAEVGIESARQFVDEVIVTYDNDLISPVVTPRFALSCSKEMMHGLGDLVRRYREEKGIELMVQSHLAENKAEVEVVIEMFGGRSYTGVYADAGLLTEKTIMAHCIHLSQEEIKLMADKGTGVAHCPNSNCSIRSGQLDVRKMDRAGVKVGLGTDCSAGYSVSMLDAMRFAVTNSNMLHINNPDLKEKPIDFADAIYLATRGAAKVAALENKVGHFEEGMKFDALRIRMSGNGNSSSCSVLFGHESKRDLVHKFVFNGDDRNIKQVWGQGRMVKNLFKSAE